jgi:hypothetical protein
VWEQTEYAPEPVVEPMNSGTLLQKHQYALAVNLGDAMVGAECDRSLGRRSLLHPDMTNTNIRCLLKEQLRLMRRNDHDQTADGFRKRLEAWIARQSSNDGGGGMHGEESITVCHKLTKSRVPELLPGTGDSDDGERRLRQEILDCLH